MVLLDQGGNMHNPPITQSISVNYQSTGGVYQTPTGHTIAITSPVSNADQYADLHVFISYASSGGGYQTPTWAYRIDSGFPGYGSPHGGTQVTGVTSINDFLNGQANGSRHIYVALLDQNGNLHNPPIIDDAWINYQYYQSGGGGYTSPSDGYQSPDSGYQSPGDGYTPPNSGYQTPSDAYQTPGGDYGVPQVPVVNNYVPVVQTLSFQPSSGSDYMLGGKVLADGGSAVFETGILISNSLGFNRTERRILTNQSSANSEFYVSVNDLTPGGTYYYKAFARNTVGETLGGWKKFKTSEQISQNSWLFETNDLGNGWRSSDWFGRFRKFNGINWIYHEHFGWLYAVDNQTVGAWFWNQDRGWCWSDKDVWPYIYQSRTGGWLYFLRHQAGSNVFYDYQNKTYFLSP